MEMKSRAREFHKSGTQLCKVEPWAGRDWHGAIDLSIRIESALNYLIKEPYRYANEIGLPLIMCKLRDGCQVT